VPSRAGWITALGAVAALIAGRSFGLLELYLLGTASLAAVAAAVVWVRWPMPPVDVHRRLRPEHPVAGMAAQAEVVLQNRGRRSAGSLVIHDGVSGTVGAHLAVPKIPGSGELTVGYRLPTRTRGPMTLGPLITERADPLGLASQRASTAQPVVVTVLPRPTAADRTGFSAGRRHASADHSATMAMTSALAELDILRPYEEGDDLRRVHWRASAHADDLLVRRDEEGRRGLLVVVLDARASTMAPDRFEAAVSDAAGLVDAAAQTGHRLRLAVSDGTDTGVVDARRGRLPLMELLAHVLQHPDAQLTLPATDARTSDRIVVLTGGDGGVLAPAGRGGPEPVVVRYDDPSPLAAR
jgi:uncharacterized protein (DUF58 family)